MPAQRSNKATTPSSRRSPSSRNAKHGENLRRALLAMNESNRVAQETIQLLTQQEATMKRQQALIERLQAELAESRFAFVQLSNLAVLNIVNAPVQ